MLARLRSYIPTTILAFLIFYFGFQALTGDRGLLSRAQRNATLHERSVELAGLTSQRQDLERRAQLLRDQGLSVELLDERARSLLGLADPRDYVIRTGR
ncbi:MAG TPA: septum formation initiator family protein [Caulobacteraceae bacterium]|jgi:cell division protein FtsB